MASHSTSPSRHSSPVLSKSVHSNADYQNDNLVGGRMAVLDDLGEHIPMVTFDVFLEKLAPPQPHFRVDATIQSLKSGAEPALTSFNRWSKFPKDPKQMDGKEDKVFSPMPDLFMKVVNAIIASSDGRLSEEDRIVDFLQNPSLALTSAERRNESKPDGYLVLKRRNKEFSKDQKEYIHWADIAVSCEYKRKDSDVDMDDDVRKALWSMHHIMRDDVRHRASFGITIENTNVRIWFCCRGVVIVSEEFDFIKEPEKLIRLFAAFAFAEEDRLGFDTTIQPVPGERGQFFITVHTGNDIQNPRKFKTIKIISSYDAEAMRGRGTRVFEAVELDANLNPFGPPVVLKDIWIDSDRMREGEILRSLYRKADEEDMKLVEKYFLTTICDGDVWIGHDIVDDTAKALLRGLEIAKDHSSLFQLQRSKIIQDSSSASGEEGLRAASRVQDRLGRHQRYEHKTHYRVVFKEVCTVINKIKILPDVMNVLKDISGALRLMRKLGWVHRDVSTGNILSYNGCGKLADLEYAKKTIDLTSHEMRTGTMEFMAIEVAAQEFLFAPNSGPPSTGPGEAFRAASQGISTASTVVPFSPNHLHDLESLWWVAVWLIIYNYFGTPPSVTLQDTVKQLRLARTLFPSKMDSTRRQNRFQKSGAFQVTCTELPSNKKATTASLDNLREHLIRHYCAIEAGLPKSVDPGSSGYDIYDAFDEFFQTIATHFSGLKLYSILELHAGLLKKETKEENSKRPRSDSTKAIDASKKIPKI